MKYRRLLTAVLSLGMLLPVSGFAASKKKPAPPAVVQPPTIAAVTANSITVKQENASKTLTIDQFTEVNVNGRKGTVAELKPGMTVNVTLGTDPTKASRVSATSK